MPPSAVPKTKVLYEVRVTEVEVGTKDCKVILNKKQCTTDKTGAN